ncbi:signal peptidase I [Lactobacillus xujianguonis]|uniref:Signal peptidase I n=1 Tax=Lactobacillus xujianguonis TaxID=2495899 RepID=A0A437SXG9_9LACO|nr:signal peptidase I [Lactobacillus xujianguonis]RVU77728.1 signal peptidase I [Lactobacillus xujianguonis]
MNKKTKGIIVWWVEFLAFLAILWGGLLALNTYVLANCTVSGISMEPTFDNGERVVAVRHAQLKRGEVVVVDAPDEPGALYIKRIIGMPGDKLVSKNNQIYINGKKINQPWLKAGWKLTDNGEDGFTGTKYSQTQNFTISSLAKTANYRRFYTTKQLKTMQKTNRVPKGTYFVMGDHRSVSKDSRYIGTIKRSKIVGVVKFSYWPLNKIKFY